MKQHKSISVLKLGEHGKNKRIWITNKKLQETFSPGEPVFITYNKESREIHVEQSFFGANHKISKRGSGVPILDIKNSEVRETLGDIERIDVLFYDDKVVIRVAKTELSKERRKNNNSMKAFELFVGGGTLSHFLQRAGFTVTGGIEISEEYTALFTNNQDSDEIYTITSDIMDVDPSYYPKDIQLLACGIPCTTFSGSNITLHEALRNKRDGKPYDEKKVRNAMIGDSLVFYVLEAIRAMNPSTVLIEEVQEFTKTPSYALLVTVLETMGYNITETISEGSHTKRKRWAMVANMNGAVKLDNLLPDDGKVIEDFLEVSSKDREWKPKGEFAPSRLNEKIGIRNHYTNERKINTVTTHGTRGSEPILSKDIEGVPHYSELTNREIANLHGVSKDFVLDPRKGISRQILGQGVTDMFLEVGKRIYDHHISHSMNQRQRGGK